ncbi:protein kinase [Myxococcaceae bacterium GXIMD 01537]
MLPLAPDVFAGRQLGKYEVLCRLSTGGMAEIFLASQRGLAGFRKLVVLKQILPDIRGEEEFVRMFLDEAKVTAAFNHPNIAQVYDLDIAEGELFLAMEFVPGATLVEVAKACRAVSEAIPIGFTLAAVRDTAVALHYAHTFTDPLGRPSSVIHRDIAEKNIMVTYEGVTKLLDFGIAKNLARASRTQVGMVKGTSGYMSPEQILGEPLDARSDLFSLGVVLHECLTGMRLFYGRTPEAGMSAVLRGDVPPPSRNNKDVPPELDAIVLKSLARKREDRYASTLEFARALERAVGALIWHPEQSAEVMQRVFADRREQSRQLLAAGQLGNADRTGEIHLEQLFGSANPFAIPPQQAAPAPAPHTPASEVPTAPGRSPAATPPRRGQAPTVEVPAATARRSQPDLQALTAVPPPPPEEPAPPATPRRAQPPSPAEAPVSTQAPTRRAPALTPPPVEAPAATPTPPRRAQAPAPTPAEAPAATPTPSRRAQASAPPPPPAEAAPVATPTPSRRAQPPAAPTAEVPAATPTPSRRAPAPPPAEAPVATPTPPRRAQAPTVETPAATVRRSQPELQALSALPPPPSENTAPDTSPAQRRTHAAPEDEDEVTPAVSSSPPAQRRSQPNLQALTETHPPEDVVAPPRRPTTEAPPARRPAPPPPEPPAPRPPATRPRATVEPADADDEATVPQGGAGRRPARRPAPPPRETVEDSVTHPNPAPYAYAPPPQEEEDAPTVIALDAEPVERTQPGMRLPVPEAAPPGPPVRRERGKLPWVLGAIGVLAVLVTLVVLRLDGGLISSELPTMAELFPAPGRDSGQFRPLPDPSEEGALTPPPPVAVPQQAQQAPSQPAATPQAPAQPEEKPPAATAQQAPTSPADAGVEPQTAEKPAEATPPPDKAEPKVAEDKSGTKRTRAPVAKKGTKRGAKGTPDAEPGESSEEKPGQASAAGGEPGQLTLVIEPFAKVYLGGRLLGETPLFKVSLPSGRHSLRLVGPDGQARRLSVEIKPGDTTSLRMPLELLARE